MTQVDGNSRGAGEPRGSGEGGGAGQSRDAGERAGAGQTPPGAAEPRDAGQGPGGHGQGRAAGQTPPAAGETGQGGGAGQTPGGKPDTAGRKRSLRREMKARLREVTREQHRIAGAQLLAFGEARGWMWIPAPRGGTDGSRAEAAPPGEQQAGSAVSHGADMHRAVSAHASTNERDRPRLFAFASMPEELNTWPLLRAMWAASVPVYLPRVESSGLRFYRVEGPDDLSRGTLGIAEPRDGCLPGTPGQPEGGGTRQVQDTVLVPGLAFTRSGLRLGRGGGYYDRLLAGIPENTLTLGVCFDFQIVEDITVDTTDRSVGDVHSFSGQDR